MSLPVEKALRKAQSHIKAGELAEAEELYKQVLSKFPKNKKAIQGYVKLKAGLSTRDDVTSKTFEQILKELIALLDNNQFEEVLSKIKPLIRSFPKIVTLHNLQGAANKGLHRYDAAIDSYKHTIKIDPSYLEGYNKIGKILLEKGDLAAAVSSYEQAIKINPNYFEGHNNLGNALTDKGDLEAAIASYKKAIKIKPDNAEVYNNIGIALRFKGELDAAKDSFDRALNIKPDYAEAYNNMGLALRDKGELDAVIESCKKAIKIKPDFAEAHLNLSHALLNAGRLKEGLDEYEWRWKTARHKARAWRCCHLVFLFAIFEFSCWTLHPRVR